MMRFGVGVVVGAVMVAGMTIAQGMQPLAVSVPTNGVLKGYTVQKAGRTVCKDPTVWNDFRGSGSFIVCD
ncbi:hypothetical protein NHN26_08875 [Rhodovulum tesquicola]|uniref:Uncharacterized protein n=1 Tax=Rhodovulum steppense TaxID=540251 RepID=A0A4R1YNA2_9RHOB|nr:MULTISPECIES: hypothetical protein [Rhodovulum]MCO8145337.1 hypothetical protein [Rhodovulum tesquicola]TCM79260.1 hypothetical protein EV216_12312 [Rhodovulum steppense]